MKCPVPEPLASLSHPMNTLVVAIHGILTRQTDPSWPDQLDVWLSRRNPGVRVLKKEYGAGPFPRWNCWVKNPRLCRGLAAELLLFLNGVKEPERPRIWIVAHSNGALIALNTVRRLIGQGHAVAGIILIGAACAADVERNGVRAWVGAGRLGSAIAYCAEDDYVLPGAHRSGLAGSLVYELVAWPYGDLGRAGWMLNGRRFPEGPHIFTRWFAGGHSGYFSLDQIEYTFRQVERDVMRTQLHAISD